MSTRAQLLDEVIAKIISGNRSTTAANLRILLNDLINSSYIPSSDGSPSGPYKGTWSNAKTYLVDDAVLHDLGFYNATANNTGEEPGTGASWTIQGVYQGLYSVGWLQILPISGNNLYPVLADLYAKKEDKLISISAKTSDYTLVIGDVSTQIDFDKSSGINCTIPLNSAVAFVVGTVIILCQKNTGQITVVPTSGVSLQSAGSLVKTNTQYSYAYLEKVATDTWRLVGDLA